MFLILYLKKSHKQECCFVPFIIPTAVTPLFTASRQAFILGIIPPDIVSFSIFFKISVEEISCIIFYSYSKLHLHWSLKAIFLILKIFAIAPAAVSPLIL